MNIMQAKKIEDIYPLTPMQNLMLMHTQGMAGSDALSNQFNYRIAGPLDVERFRRCLQAIQNRHHALRSFFLWEDLVEPLQLVHRSPALRFDHIDLCQQSTHDKKTRLDEILSEDQFTPFDLRRPPLSRFILVRLESGLHHLVWSRHHLILDRWSVDLMFNELLAFYDMQGDVDEGVLPEPAQYRAYIDWLRRQRNEDAIAYWQHNLQSVTRPTLIADPARNRASYSANSNPHVELALPDSLLRELQELCAAAGVSMAVLLQAALAMLLAESNRCEEAVFGLTVSGRPPDLPGVESIMGSFINNVPAVIRLTNEQAVKSWFRDIQNAQAQRSRYDYLSLADIRRTSQFEPGLPAFDLLALLHSPATEVRRGQELEIEQIDGPIDSVLPFVLSLAETMGTLKFAGVYDPSRVSEDTANSFLDTLRVILNNMIAVPEATVGELRSICAADVVRSNLTCTNIRQVAGSSTQTRSTTTRAGFSAEAQTLADIWCRILGIDAVGLDDDFFALGGTSLQAVEMFIEIERCTGQVLPISTLFETGSIRALLEYMDAPTPQSSALIEIQPNGNRPPLYIVPGIGGDSVALSSLARVLGPNQPFYGLQSRGLDGRERPQTNIEEIAATYIKAMNLVNASDSFVLCGLCWGSAVALEMAQQLAADNHAPKMLIVFDPAEHRGNLADAAKLDPAFAKMRFLANRLSLYWSELRESDGKERIAKLKEKGALLLDKLTKRDALTGVRTEIYRETVMAANTKALLSYSALAYSHPVRPIFTIDRDQQVADIRQEWLQIVAPRESVIYVPGKDTGDAMSLVNVRFLADAIRNIIDELPNH